MLQAVFGITKIESLGIFPRGSSLELIEYVVHELAHALTMGFEKFPTKLPSATEDVLTRYSAVTNDHLEIDTAFVTHNAMSLLKLVKPADLEKFAHKCAGSLATKRYEDELFLVMYEMDLRSRDAVLNEHARTIVSIFRAPLPLVKATFLLKPDAA